MRTLPSTASSATVVMVKERRRARSPAIVGEIALAVPIGVGCGMAGAVFLRALAWATAAQTDHGWLLFLLPPAGAGMAWLYAGVGRSAVGGANLILDQIHEPQGSGVPLRLFPLILLTTVATHLFGGSAGREGTAVQMGGAIGGQLARTLRLDGRQTRLALMCGISGGFAGVFGTPLAGTIFAIEVLAIGRIRFGALLPCLASAFASDEAVRLLRVHHGVYRIAAIPDLSASLILKVALAGVAFGVASALFSEATEAVSHAAARLVADPVARTALGGGLVVGATLLLGTRIYNGLSLPLLSSAFTDPAAVPTPAFLAKLGLTALTLGVGFKGGEVTPLFVIGATLGVSLAAPLSLPPSFLAALGFVAVFAAAANTPFACVAMGAELFSGGILYFGVATFIAYAISGHRGIYPAQRVRTGKRPLRDPRLRGATLREIRRARRSPAPSPEPVETPPEPSAFQ